jgi:hypothetical protein
MEVRHNNALEFRRVSSNDDGMATGFDSNRVKDITSFGKGEMFQVPFRRRCWSLYGEDVIDKSIQDKAEGNEPLY